MMLKRLTQSQITMPILGRKYFSQELDGFHLSQQQHSPIPKISKNQQQKQLINLKHLMIVQVHRKRQIHLIKRQNKITAAALLVKHRKKKNLKQKQRPLMSKFRLGFGGFLFGLVVALLALAIVFRRRIRGYLLLRSLRNSPEFGKTYHRLMKLLASYGYVRESSETLRHFSARVDADLTTSEFSRLTKMYETQLYSKNLTEKVIAAEETQLVQQIIARLTK